ncbi:MAG TPA: type II toxin-antitoxin system VapC family toxin [Stellaceae bacterium]|nr:type II toxin-antitoxin system VapC family toxin [Stellaceae bacterium]
MYLLDTNIVSELRRARPHGAVIAWLRDIRDEDLHVSAVTIGEIQSGIKITREQDEAKAAEMEAWLVQVTETYNVIGMDARAFRSWARLIHRRTDDLIEDAMIAATAAVHNLTVVTRNVRDFAVFNVPTLNPFDMKAG